MIRSSGFKAAAAVPETVPTDEQQWA